MDTYEENHLTPQPEPEETRQPLNPLPERTEQPPAEQEPVFEEHTAQPGPEDSADGFYHGTGAGIRETAFISSPATQKADPAQPNTQDAGPVTPAKRRRKKKGLAGKILKYSVASLLILALVSAACGISIVVTNRHWQAHNQRLLQNFEEQIQVLRQELETHKANNAGVVIVPTEGLTPSQIYDRNIASIVAVNAVVRTTQNGQVYEGVNAGSGFVLSGDGYIVTNHHVIEGSTSINVVFVNGKRLTAQLIGSDAINDIALLKVAAEDLQPVTIGSSSNLRVGEQVLTIGNALGELNFSLTVGYVSGTDRRITTDGAVTNMIQTDASINSGNSGGPLFNARGEVVGIITAKYSGTSSSGASIEGVGFALPVDDVIGMLEDLRRFGYITGAYMGVMVQDVDPVAAERYGFPLGAYVADAPGSAAQKAGIKAKDIITNVGGYTITCMSDLTRALRNFKAGEQTTVVVWRSGQREVLSIVFDEKPHS